MNVIRIIIPACPAFAEDTNLVVHIHKALALVYVLVRKRSSCAILGMPIPITYLGAEEITTGWLNPSGQLQVESKLHLAADLYKLSHRPLEFLSTHIFQVFTVIH